MESTAHAAQAVEIPQWIEHLRQSHHSTAEPAWSPLSIRKLTDRAQGRNAMMLLDGTTAIWHRTEERRYPADRCRSAALPYPRRSEEHTSELQSLMRISYAVFCLNTKTKNTT